MDRAGVGTAMLMLTALSVIAPAAEWIGGSDAPESAASPSAIVAAKPSRSAEELREVLSAYRDTGVDGAHVAGSTRRSAGALRDPFAAAPISAVAMPPAEQPMPVVELIGIIETPNGGIATLSIDGNIASLRVGESSGGVRVTKIVPPDAMVWQANGKTVTARVQ